MTFRRGEARVEAGKRLPHTGPALLYGTLTGAHLSLPRGVRRRLGLMFAHLVLPTGPIPDRSPTGPRLCR